MVENEFPKKLKLNPIGIPDQPPSSKLPPVNGTEATPLVAMVTALDGANLAS